MSVRFQPFEVSADARHQRASISKLLDSPDLVSQIKSLERSHLPEIPTMDVNALLPPAVTALGTPGAGCSSLSMEPSWYSFGHRCTLLVSSQMSTRINLTAAGLDAILASKRSQAKKLALLAVSIRYQYETMARRKRAMLMYLIRLELGSGAFGVHFLNTIRMV